MNLIYQTSEGQHFNEAATEAQLMSIASNNNVEFEFNGVTCIVNDTTNIELLYRDYSNAHLMEWESVGPANDLEYSAETQLLMTQKRLEREVAREKKNAEYKAKENAERMAFETKTYGIEIDLIDKQSWDLGLSKNTDPYGKCVYDYAESWAKLMQVEIMTGKTVADCAGNTSHQLGFYGITGFMYGAAVSVLSQCWKYGEDLRKWHNGEYNHSGDGVVNPAVLTFATNSNESH